MNPKLKIQHFLIAFGVGLLYGYQLLPIMSMALVYFILVGIVIWFAIQNEVLKLLTYLPYLIYAEIIVRCSFDSLIPYLTVQYTYIIIFIILLSSTTKNKQVHTSSYILIIAFGLLEILNGFFPATPKLYRATLFNTFSMILAIVWASYYTLSPKEINKTLTNIKIASFVLCGYIIVAHLKGKINYGTFSNSAASNGLAPVQISGYLGVASSLFFIANMSDYEKKNRLINIIGLVMVPVLMVLTLSRGGLYFVSAIAVLYFYFNRAKLGNYFKFLMLIPIIMIALNFIVGQTGGAVLDRYSEEGSSNRDRLVIASFKLFLEHPVFGVGTSNYASAIVNEGLFSQFSTAHNEFARSMAEHGIFGIITYWGFFIATAIKIAKRPRISMQFSYYFFLLFCFIVIHNGLKISLQQLLMVLAVGNSGEKTIATSIKSKYAITTRSSNELQKSA